MTKSAEHQQLQKTAIDATRAACHVLSVSWPNSPSVFQSNQSIAPIDISCSVNTKVAIFSSKHWSGLSPFLVALSILRVAYPYLAQRKCRRVNESETNEECHCLDWSWNFNTDVLETFLNLAVHYPLDFAPEIEFAKCCTLWARNVKCHARAVSDMFCHFRFRYKCSHY